MQAAPVDADGLDVAHVPALVFEHVAHGLQLVGDLAGERRVGVVIDGVLGQQLMVHALGGEAGILVMQFFVGLAWATLGYRLARSRSA